MLVISWRGLPENKEWFRVCVDRIFECIPRFHIKDIVETRKPTGNRETIDAAHRLIQKAPAFLTHSNKFKKNGTVKWLKRSITKAMNFAEGAGTTIAEMGALAESLGLT